MSISTSYQISSSQQPDDPFPERERTASIGEILKTGAIFGILISIIWGYPAYIFAPSRYFPGWYPNSSSLIAAACLITGILLFAYAGWDIGKYALSELDVIFLGMLTGVVAGFVVYALVGTAGISVIGAKDIFLLLPGPCDKNTLNDELAPAIRAITSNLLIAWFGFAGAGGILGVIGGLLRLDAAGPADDLRKPPLSFNILSTVQWWRSIFRGMIGAVVIDVIGISLVSFLFSILEDEEAVFQYTSSTLEDSAIQYIVYIFPVLSIVLLLSIAAILSVGILPRSSAHQRSLAMYSMLIVISTGVILFVLWKWGMGITLQLHIVIVPVVLLDAVLLFFSVRLIRKAGILGKLFFIKGKELFLASLVDAVLFTLFGAYFISTLGASIGGVGVLLNDLLTSESQRVVLISDAIKNTFTLLPKVYLLILLGSWIVFYILGLLTRPFQIIYNWVMK